MKMLFMQIELVFDKATQKQFSRIFNVTSFENFQYFDYIGYETNRLIKTPFASSVTAWFELHTRNSPVECKASMSSISLSFFISNSMYIYFGFFSLYDNFTAITCLLIWVITYIYIYILPMLRVFNTVFVRLSQVKYSKQYVIFALYYIAF